MSEFNEFDEAALQGLRDGPWGVSETERNALARAMQEMARLRAENAELRAQIESMNRIAHEALTWRHEHEKVCAGKWVKVTERLPEEFDTVLVLTDTGNMDLAWQESGKWDSDTQFNRGEPFTHFLDARLPN